MTSVIVISLLQFGQISIVGTTEDASLMLMMFPFARRNVGASEEAHPGVGACQSEKQELRTGPVALRQRLDREHCAPIICKSREKMTAAVRACRRAGTRLIAITAPGPPAVVPQGVADGASVLLVIACPQRNQRHLQE
jgi:hypothetical protein